MPLLAPVTTAVRVGAEGLVGLGLMAAIVLAHCRVVTATTLVRAAGVVGGLCWIARALLDNGDGTGAAVDALHYGGLGLLVIALLGIGAGLASGLLALRAVVAICLVALAWAVTSFLHHQYSDRAVDGILGGLMVAYCALGMLVRRRRGGGGGSHGGSHGGTHGGSHGRGSHRSPGSHAA